MVWTASDAKEIDRLSSEVYSIPALHLMEEAGQAIYRLALSLWKPHCRFLILAGAGNNGGDALVVARRLYEAGFFPRVIDVSEGKESVERLAQRLRLEALGCSLFSARVLIDDEGPWIIIDGLLGIGLSGPLRPGLVFDVLQRASAISAVATLAIDLPSGLDADCFDQPPPLLKTTDTITFQSLKPLHLVHPSREYCGKIHVVNDIGFSPLAVTSVMAAQTVKLKHDSDVTSIDKLWSFLPTSAHKYDRGHVLVIGGSAGKVGAILHSAKGAWRAGAGWVSVAPLSDELMPPLPSAYTYESFALKGKIDTQELMTFLETRRVKAVLIGPGTMQNPLNAKLLRMLSTAQKKAGLRLIFDAGALDKFLELSEGLEFHPDHTLLTPHPGEWKKLSSNHGEIKSMKDFYRLQDIFKTFSVIYKSSTPIVLHPERATFLSGGNNRLGRAGSGDTLAGLVLGLSAVPRPIDELAALAQKLMMQSFT